MPMTCSCRDVSARLTAIPGWDLIADNIAFVPDTPDLAASGAVRAVTDTGLSALDLAEFVRGNLPRKNRPRGELGFLKPLIRRDFIDRHGLRYNPICGWARITTSMPARSWPGRGSS
jgi:succinoglycan biosynthesis protein ExoU